MVGVGCYFIIVLFHYNFVSYDKLSLPHSSGEFQQCASMLLPRIFTGYLHILRHWIISDYDMVMLYYMQINLQSYSKLFLCLHFDNSSCLEFKEQRWG